MIVSGKIAFVNQPKGASRYGSLKIGDKYVSIDKSLLSNFSKDQVVSLEVKESPAPDGRMYYNYVGEVHHEPIAQVPSPIGGSIHPSAINHTGRDIFVTGVVGRAMGSGKFEFGDILMLTDAAKEAYERVLVNGEDLSSSGTNLVDNEGIPF